MNTHQPLLDMLRVAVPLEMASVTEASMCLFLADRDRYLRSLDRVDALRKQVREIHAEANKSKRELTPAERSEVDRLNATIGQLYDQVDTQTMVTAEAFQEDPRSRYSHYRYPWITTTTQDGED
jgi:hypothetical protein